MVGPHALWRTDCGMRNLAIQKTFVILGKPSDIKASLIVRSDPRNLQPLIQSPNHHSSCLLSLGTFFIAIRPLMLY